MIKESTLLKQVNHQIKSMMGYDPRLIIIGLRDPVLNVITGTFPQLVASPGQAAAAKASPELASTSDSSACEAKRSETTLL